jgi:hypothetical protein
MHRLSVLAQQLEGRCAVSECGLERQPTYGPAPQLGKDANFPQATTAAKFPDAAHDALGLDSFLTPAERDVKQRVRKFMVRCPPRDLPHTSPCAQPAGRLTASLRPQEAKVAPIIADYWERAEFPHELVAELGKLGVGGATIKGAQPGQPDPAATGAPWQAARAALHRPHAPGAAPPPPTAPLYCGALRAPGPDAPRPTCAGYGCSGLGVVANAMACMEMARVDASVSTFYLVHNFLALLTIGLLVRGAGGEGAERCGRCPARQQRWGSSWVAAGTWPATWHALPRPPTAPRPLPLPLPRSGL